jgi:hypothetical protein
MSGDGKRVFVERGKEGKLSVAKMHFQLAIWQSEAGFLSAAI